MVKIETMKQIIEDLDIVQEAIKNEDYQDALKMIIEIQQDLKIFDLL